MVDPRVSRDQAPVPRSAAFADRLDEWISAQEGWRPNVRNFSLKLVRRAEAARDDARPRLGRPRAGRTATPTDTKRIYVWFDAVIGYLSASVEWAHNRGTPDAWRDWWQNPEAGHFYFMGKDNIVFHTVIWPAMLLGYGSGGELGAGRGDLHLPTNVVASEYLTMEGKKASTSRNLAIWVSDFLSRYDPDPLRYYLTAGGPETQDTDFTWDEFVRRNNDELLANLGQPRQPHARQRVPELRRGTRARAAARGGHSPARRSRGCVRRGGDRDRADPVPCRGRRRDAGECAREPVRRRAGALGARRDRPRARGNGAARRAPLRRLAEDAARAVPALHVAGRARAAGVSAGGSSGRPSSAPRARTTARRTRSSPATTRAGSARGRRASCRPVRRCVSLARSSASSRPRRRPRSLPDSASESPQQ